jgi:HK97 family phage prohead protease
MSNKQIFEFKSLNISIKSFDSIQGIFKGYASAFNKVDKVKDTILPQAFDKSIESFNNGSKIITVNYDHWEQIELSANLSSISKDDVGLMVEFKLSDEARKTYKELFAEMIVQMEKGQLFMSIGGFVVKSSLGEERWIKKEVGLAIDEIEEFDLQHVAVTYNPIDTNAKMMEMKSERGFTDNKPSVNKSLEAVDGEVSAIKFLAANKSEMSNTSAKNFVLHLKSLWKKELDNSLETVKSENESQGDEVRCSKCTSVIGSEKVEKSSIEDFVNYLK